MHLRRFEPVEVVTIFLSLYIPIQIYNTNIHIYLHLGRFVRVRSLKSPNASTSFVHINIFTYMYICAYTYTMSINIHIHLDSFGRVKVVKLPKRVHIFREYMYTYLHTVHIYIHIQEYIIYLHTYIRTCKYVFIYAYTFINHLGSFGRIKVVEFTQCIRIFCFVLRHL